MPEKCAADRSALYLLAVVRAVQEFGISFPRVLSKFKELLHSNL